LAQPGAGIASGGGLFSAESQCLFLTEGLFRFSDCLDQTSELVMPPAGYFLVPPRK